MTFRETTIKYIKAEEGTGMTHKTILVFWKDRQGEHVFQLKNVTEAVARERAEFFGYVKPKWWEFWKDELHLIFD